MSEITDAEADDALRVINAGVDAATALREAKASFKQTVGILADREQLGDNLSEQRLLNLLGMAVALLALERAKVNTLQRSQSAHKF